MEFSAGNGAWRSVFAVPCSVVDQHLKLCGAAQLKTLLFLLRTGGYGTAESIARELNLPPADVEDALLYWQQSGILETGAAESGRSEPESTAESEVPEKEPEKLELKPLSVPIKPPNPKEIQALAADPEVRSLLHEAEALLGKTFTFYDTSTIIWLHNWAGVPTDLLLTVIAYCKQNGRASMNQIQKTAVGWLNDGIDSTEKAEGYMERKGRSDDFESRIRRLFGIRDRTLITKEREYAEGWEKMGFSDDMLTLAYERTIEKTGKLRFGYINTILNVWHSGNIRTPEQAEAESVVRRRKTTQSGKEQSYNIEEIERMFEQVNSELSGEGRR